MGRDIEVFEITEEDRNKFADRVYDCLEALKITLDKPGFGEGAISLGAELECCIVTDKGDVAPINKEILDDLNDPQFQHELNKFNLEFNLSPVPAKGAPFTKMRIEADKALNRAQQLAKNRNANLILTGILPTLKEKNFKPSYMTDVGRYHMLDRELHKMRGEAFNINIDGKDPLKMKCDHVTLEGANTSFQLHLRVEPEKFADTFNAAQIMTPMSVALAANSPLLLGHRLWQETRVALFRQSIDYRHRDNVNWRQPCRISFGYGWVRDGAYELFSEAVALYPSLFPVLGNENPYEAIRNGRLPKLEELNLHMGTTWPWNRAVYSHIDGGHLRIEMRSLPSGPTLVDMAANAAFLIGLTVGFRTEVREFLPSLPFRHAEYNFYRAAQSGLEANIIWPDKRQRQSSEKPIIDVIKSLLPLMEKGLSELGVDEDEISKYKENIENRLNSRMTGSSWQLMMLKKYKNTGLNTEDSCKAMTLKYIEQQYKGKSIIEWQTDP